MRIKIFHQIKMLVALFISSVSLFFVVVACSNEQESMIFNYQNRISLVSNMPETWPQYQALKTIVANYNKHEQSRPHFMQIVFLSQKDVKTKNLGTKVNKLILSGSNDIPNLLLDRDFGQMYQLAAFNRLLNLASPTLDGTTFNPYFVRGLTSLVIRNYEQQGLYAAPTLTLANNSIVINKPVLKRIFNLMAAKGAIIERTLANPIVRTIMASTTSLAQDHFLLDSTYDSQRAMKNPDSLWIDRLPGSSSLLENYKINDQLFSTYQKLYGFVQKAHTTLALASPLYIYGSGVLHDFLTLLDAQQKNLNEPRPLFEMLSNQKYTFPFLRSESARNKLRRAFEKLINLARLGYGDYPENYNIVGLRNGQHGITNHFSVSARYSYRSTVFGNYTNNGFGFDDIMYLPSPSKWSEATPVASRQLSRWLIMGLKTTSSKNQAAKAFVNYLYNGTLHDDTSDFRSHPRRVADFLQWESSYGVPLQNDKSLAFEYESVYKKLGRKNRKYAAIYRGLRNMIDSLVDQEALRSFDGNHYTSKLLDIIRKILQSALRNPTKWNGNRFVAEILKNKSDFQH